MIEGGAYKSQVLSVLPDSAVIAGLHAAQKAARVAAAPAGLRSFRRARFCAAIAATVEPFCSMSADWAIFHL